MSEAQVVIRTNDAFLRHWMLHWTWPIALSSETDIFDYVNMGICCHDCILNLSMKIHVVTIRAKILWYYQVLLCWESEWVWEWNDRTTMSSVWGKLRPMTSVIYYMQLNHNMCRYPLCHDSQSSPTTASLHPHQAWDSPVVCWTKCSTHSTTQVLIVDPWVNL